MITGEDVVNSYSKKIITAICLVAIQKHFFKRWELTPEKKWIKRWQLTLHAAAALLDWGHQRESNGEAQHQPTWTAHHHPQAYLDNIENNISNLNYGNRGVGD